MDLRMLDCLLLVVAHLCWTSLSAHKDSPENSRSTSNDSLFRTELLSEYNNNRLNVVVFACTVYCFSRTPLYRIRRGKNKRMRQNGWLSNNTGQANTNVESLNLAPAAVPHNVHSTRSNDKAQKPCYETKERKQVFHSCTQVLT